MDISKKSDNIFNMNETTIGKFCTFPDQTKVNLHSILDVGESQSYVCYFWENIPQSLWVPNEFISNEI